MPSKVTGDSAGAGPSSQLCRLHLSSRSLLQFSPAFGQALSCFFLSSYRYLHISLFQVQVFSNDLLWSMTLSLLRCPMLQTPLTFPESLASLLGRCRTVHRLPWTLFVSCAFDTEPDPPYVCQLSWGQGTRLHFADCELWNMPVFAMSISASHFSPNRVNPLLSPDPRNLHQSGL